MGVTGDFDRLNRLRANLRRVASAGLTAELAQRLGETSMKLVADEFRAERNPYGVPWQPHSKNYRRKRGAMARARLLRDTGRMAASVNFAAEARAFRMNIPVRYAPVHQYGATIAARSNVRGQKLRGSYTKNGRFRFVKKGQDGILLNAKRATLGAVTIPQRQILPMASTGGLGSIWLKAYNRAASDLLKRRMQAAA